MEKKGGKELVKWRTVQKGGGGGILAKVLKIANIRKFCKFSIFTAFKLMAAVK